MLATLVSVSIYALCWVDSVGHVLQLSSIPANSYNISIPSSSGFSEENKGRIPVETSNSDSFSTWCLAVGLSISSHLLPEEDFLMTARQGTHLWVYQNIIRNYFPVLVFIFFICQSCLVPLMSLCYLVSASWPFRQHWAWALSCGMRLNWKQTLVGHSKKLCAIIASVHFVGRTDCLWSTKVLGLGWCTLFSFRSL